VPRTSRILGRRRVRSRAGDPDDGALEPAVVAQPRLHGVAEPRVDVHRGADRFDRLAGLGVRTRSVYRRGIVVRFPAEAE